MLDVYICHCSYSKAALALSSFFFLASQKKETPATAGLAFRAHTEPARFCSL